MNCNKCGKELLANDKFCSGCKNAVSEMVLQGSNCQQGVDDKTNV